MADQALSDYSGRGYRNKGQPFASLKGADKLGVDKPPAITEEEAMRFIDAMKQCGKTQKGTLERLDTFAAVLPILMKGYKSKVTDRNLSDDEKKMLDRVKMYIDVIAAEVKDGCNSWDENTRKHAFNVYASAKVTMKIIELAKTNIHADIQKIAVDYLFDVVKDPVVVKSPEKRIALTSGKEVSLVEFYKDALLHIALEGDRAHAGLLIVNYFARGLSPDSKQFSLNSRVGDISNVSAADLDDAIVKSVLADEFGIEVDKHSLEKIAEGARCPDTKDMARAMLSMIRGESVEITALAEQVERDLLRLTGRGNVRKDKPEPPPAAAAALARPDDLGDESSSKVLEFRRPVPKVPRELDLTEEEGGTAAAGG